jgi:hypothetical protein
MVMHPVDGPRQLYRTGSQHLPGHAETACRAQGHNKRNTLQNLFAFAAGIQSD